MVSWVGMKTTCFERQSTTTKMEVKPDEVIFISSNRWDVAGSKNAGFRPIWVNRGGNPDEYPEFQPMQVVKSLSEIASVKV